MNKSKIKLFIMDVDGTLTDGKIYIGNNGEIFKSFNVKDGYGINLLHQHSIIPVIVTGRTSEIVSVRARELDIVEIYQGVEDKVKVFETLKQKYELINEEAAFVGDDLNDLELMKKVGLKLAVNDAANEIKAIADYTSSFDGGDGAVRDLIEKIIVGKL